MIVKILKATAHLTFIPLPKNATTELEACLHRDRMKLIGPTDDAFLVSSEHSGEAYGVVRSLIQPRSSSSSFCSTSASESCKAM